MFRALHRFNNTQCPLDGMVNVDLGFGMHSFIQLSMMNDGMGRIDEEKHSGRVLFFGCTYMFEDIPESNKKEGRRAHYKYQFERHIVKHLRVASKIYQQLGLRIDPESVPSFERNTHILSQLSKSMISGHDTFKHKAKICFQVYEDYQKLKSNLKDLVDEYRGAEWRKIFKNLLFIRLYVAPERNRICQVCGIERTDVDKRIMEASKSRYSLYESASSKLKSITGSTSIFSVGGRDKSKVIDEVINVLATMKDAEKSITCATCESQSMKIFLPLYPEREHIMSFELQFCLPTFQNPHKLQDIKISIERDSDLVVDEPLSIYQTDCIYASLILSSIRNHYYWFNDEYNANEYCTDWQCLDRFRHIMQRLSHDDINKPLRIGAKWAMDIIEAHNVLIMLYDGLHD
ncbi:MAG: hypothetical protein U1C51_03240, partial [Candidatus Izemoplasmatales bacterium]|nr:hypothetical protein [Candidatus Izemoplasmatales bacterium]